jgi:mannose-6-phosphate isomerase-like protein (cupin superfamily)
MPVLGRVCGHHELGKRHWPPPSAAAITRGGTMMSGYTKKDLRHVKNQAPDFGMPPELEARFARTPLGGESLGLSLFRLAPNFRIPFGHKHVGQEEVYVITQGSGRIKVEDEIVEVRQWDAIRFDKDTMRDVEAGPDGIEYVAFGAGDDPAEVEMAQNWWSD